MGFETDTKVLKLGDGTTRWNSLGTPSAGYSIVDAKGDLIVGTADNAAARLPVGANGKVLKASSSTATGLEWGDAAGKAEFNQVSYLTIAETLGAQTASSTLENFEIGSLTGVKRVNVYGINSSDSNDNVFRAEFIPDLGLITFWDSRGYGIQQPNNNSSRPLNGTLPASGALWVADIGAGHNTRTRFTQFYFDGTKLYIRQGNGGTGSAYTGGIRFRVITEK